MSPLVRCATTSPLRPAWPRTLIFFTSTVAGPGTSVTVGSVMRMLSVAARLRFLCLTGLACLTGPVGGVLMSTTAGAGDTAFVGEIIGAGIGGSAFVLSCAMALVAAIIPKINQQFVFMIPTVKFL